MTNNMLRKQLVFRAKALTGKLVALRKKLGSGKLDEQELARIKEEIAEVQKRIDELQKSGPGAT